MDIGISETVLASNIIRRIFTIFSLINDTFITPWFLNGSKRESADSQLKEAVLQKHIPNTFLLHTIRKQLQNSKAVRSKI